MALKRLSRQGAPLKELLPAANQQQKKEKDINIALIELYFKR